MSQRVNITKRVKTAAGWKFCRVVISANGKIKPDVVLIDGREEIHTEGRYYIDYREAGQRHRLPAGDNAADAMKTARQQERVAEAQRAAEAAGITLPSDEPEEGSRNLREAVEAYLVEIEGHRKPKTLSVYSTSLHYFLESCHKKTLEQIRRTDLLAYITFLRKKKLSDRTVANKFENVMQFLKLQKITGLITKNDRPTFTEEEVETYTQEELDAFFAACDPTETLWFEFFYRTAMREQEVMHVSWRDINFEDSSVTVRENKEFDFKPKAYKGRHIPIPSRLLAMLKDWKKRAKFTLVFPTSGGQPKLNFLDDCKAIAERAGLDDERFYLHKFRATRATRLLQGGMDIKSVQKMLGHSDLQSTLRYLGAQRSDVLQSQIESIDDGETKAGKTRRIKRQNAANLPE